MTKVIKCIVCPIGCDVNVTLNGNEVVSVENNQCKRGYDYSVSESINPCRMITTTVFVEGGSFPVTSVRTDIPVEKDKVFACVDEIKKIRIKTPFKVGDVILHDILSTGANIIVTRSDLGE